MNSKWPVRPGLLIAAAWATGLIAGCNAAPAAVVNPDYLGWARFAPGSFVTFEVTRTTGDTVQELRITEKLLREDARMVVLERTTVDRGAAGKAGRVVRRSELATIHPGDDPRTHPDAKLEELRRETLRIAGKEIVCRVRRLEVHAEFRGFGPVAADVYAEAWLSPKIPGGLAKIIFRTRTADHSVQVRGHAVAFQVVEDEED